MRIIENPTPRFSYQDLKMVDPSLELMPASVSPRQVCSFTTGQGQEKVKCSLGTAGRAVHAAW